MARPKTVLIDRGMIIRESIKLLEKGGLDGFNLRALATRLSAHPSSIYHYYDGRAAILSAVAGSILRDVPVPPMQDDWRDWAVDTTMAYWRALLERPFIIAILLAGYEPATGVRSQLGTTMTEACISPRRQGEILHAWEGCVFGFAQVYSANPEAEGVESLDDVAETLRRTLRFILNDKIVAG